MTSSVEIRNLSHRYSAGEAVLDAVNLSVPEGSIYGFLGPNGAGKTTTLRLLLGLLRIQEGTVSIFGQPLTSNRVAVLRKIGSFIETPSIYEHLTAIENLRVWQLVYQCPPSRISETLKLVGLQNTAQKRAGNFSLGMKQRLSIAVALLHAPSLLILDEPTNGLDPAGIVEIRELLIKLNREQGVTILISSHLLPEIDKIATDVGIIHQGKIVFQGTKERLRQQRRDVISVSFVTNDHEAALKIIGKQITDARIRDQNVVVPPLANDEISRVNQALVEKGIDVYEIRREHNDLEAIFMSLIGESAR